MLSLSEKLVSLDKTNKSKTVGRHIIAIANAKAMNEIFKGDMDAACTILAEAAENELLTPDELNAMEKTAHGRIFKAHPEPIDDEEFNEKLEELKKLAELGRSGVVDCIGEIVPNFHRAANEEKNIA